MYDKPEMGDKIRFRPTDITYCDQGQKTGRDQDVVTGTVVYINEAHRYFMLEYDCHGQMLRESFKYR